MIPLNLRLKKNRHKEIAAIEDLIMEELRKEFERAVLHGGTAIWRCYNGNRFSEDIDVYIPKNTKKIENLFKNLEKRGLIIERKKVLKNSIYSLLKLGRTAVRFEALFKISMGFLKEYETIDGNLITIRTLSPEELINEKVCAYLNRFKIRDLYDIFFLLRYVKNKKDISNNLKKLVFGFKEPIDKNELRVLIFEGLVPETKEMLNYIKRFL